MPKTVKPPVLKKPLAQTIRPARAITRTDVAAFSLATVLCIVALIIVMKLWKADPQVPFEYFAGGDAFSQAMLTKGVIDNPWYLHNKLMGAPGAQDFHDYPLTDTLHFFIMKLLGLFYPSFGFVLNAFFLLTFVLTTWTALFVFRSLHFAYPPAIVGSIVYAFLPYHFWRFQHHLLLGSYYCVPLMILATLWCMQGVILEFRDGPLLRSWHLTRYGIGAIIICAVMGCAGTYYAFFAFGFLLVAALAGLFQEHGIRRLLQRIAPPALLATVVGASFLANLLPTVLFVARHGKNMILAIRNPIESETYGLRITQMFLPIIGHRIPFLANIKNRYMAIGQATYINENISVSLGLIILSGFCLLIALCVAGLPQIKNRDLLKKLSVLNVAGVLIGTAGGFGAVFAWTINPEIRCYNRIVVYIAFFSICAVVLLLDALWRSWANSFNRAALLLLGLAVLGCGAIFDQTGTFDVPPYPISRANYDSDEAFVHGIEASMPPNAMIFQLPYLEFPEPGVVPGAMSHYDHLRGYLHSATLRWSYGTVKGRFGDAWLRDLCQRPTQDMVEALAVAGFSGIYLDGFGFKDTGAAIESELKSILGTDLIVSPNHRLGFYSLIPFAERFRRQFTDQAWQAMHTALMEPLLIHWRTASASLEHAPGYDFHWCGRSCEIVVENLTTHSLQTEIQLELIDAAPEPATVQIEGPAFSGSEPLGDGKTTIFAHRLDIPPGERTIRFVSSGRVIHGARDPRDLVFQIRNLRATLVGGNANPAPPSGRQNPLFVPHVINAN